MPWLDDISYVLEEEDVAIRGTNLFHSTRAVIPKLASGAATISLVDTGGTSPERIHNLPLRPAYLNTTAQVVARAASFSVALAKAQAAWYALFAIRNQFIGSGEVLPWYLWIKPLQNPTDLGIDGVGNIKVGFNVTGRMRP